MTDDRRDDGGSDEQAAFEDELERTRKLILERRNRFMAAALAGLGMTGGNACTSSSVCLSLAFDAGTAGAGNSGGSSGVGGKSGAGGAGTGGAGTGGTAGARPNVCLSGRGAVDICPDGSPPPCVCLEAPVPDAGSEDDGGEGEASDAG
jgi:hypothetical protein